MYECPETGYTYTTNKEPAMSETFEELYTPLLKDVFKIHAQKQLDQGDDGLVSARAYAEQGKPEFALAFLLLLDITGDEKREILARFCRVISPLDSSPQSALPLKVDHQVPCWYRRSSRHRNRIFENFEFSKFKIIRNRKRQNVGLLNRCGIFRTHH